MMDYVFHFLAIYGLLSFFMDWVSPLLVRAIRSARPVQEPHDE